MMADGYEGDTVRHPQRVTELRGAEHHGDRHQGTSDDEEPVESRRGDVVVSRDHARGSLARSPARRTSSTGVPLRAGLADENHVTCLPQKLLPTRSQTRLAERTSIIG